MSDQITTDPIVATIEYLKADGGVAAQVDGRVYGGDLPRDMADTMPVSAVVVAYGGPLGTFGNANRWGDHRLHIRCYGATPYEARQVGLAVHAALKGLRRAPVTGGAVIHWANPTGGTAAVRDPDTGWPYLDHYWQILISE